MSDSQPPDAGRIVDLSGQPLRADAAREIVDPLGRRISSVPATRDNGTVPGSAGAPTRGPGVVKGHVGIQGMLIACACSDGQFRQVIMEDKDARKVWKLIQRLHKGNVPLQMEPVFLVVRQKPGLPESRPPATTKQTSGLRRLFQKR
jgi:hypothetical protein